jgi:hypothetical protein
MHAKLFARKTGDPRSGRSPSMFGPVEEGLWPKLNMYVTGKSDRGNIIDEASEQRCLKLDVQVFF